MTLKFLIGAFVYVHTSLVWSAPICDDEFLTLFSAARYKTLIDRFLPTKSQGTDPAVRIELAAMYKWGIGIESNEHVVGQFLGGLSKDEIQQVINYWKFCAKSDNVAARVLLGIVYYDGLGVQQDLNQAKQYFDNLSAPLARLGLAATYNRQGQEEIVNSLIDDVIASSPEINAFKVAELFYHGIIFDRDMVSAARWYEKSANEGSYHALGILGYMYTTGLGVEKSQEKGRYWLDRQSAHPDFKSDNSGSPISGIYSRTKINPP